MTDLLTRFVVAIETIAEALSKPTVSLGLMTTDTPVLTEAPKRTRRTKAEIEAEKAAETVMGTPAPEPTPEPEFEYTMLQKAIVDLAKISTEGKAKAVAILKLRNVKSAKEAPSSEWEAMYNEALAAMDTVQDTTFDLD